MDFLPLIKMPSLEEFQKELENILGQMGYEIAHDVQIFEDMVGLYVLQKGKGYFCYLPKGLNYVKKFGRLLPAEVGIMEKEGLIRKK